MKTAFKVILPMALSLLGSGFIAPALAADPPAPEEGTVHVSAFDLPPSSALDAEARAVLKRQADGLAAMVKNCPKKLRDLASPEDAVAYRHCHDEDYLKPLAARHRERYKVTIQPLTVAGVATEVFTPVEGVSAANRQRVLINLHGGGFIVGGGWGGQVESIPIASVGKIEVVSVDYRMAPEHRFPAASEDVAAVYKALLKDYKPQNIGIYGCSAGGILTGQALAWFQKEGLPMPGAVGIFCAGSASPSGTDSGAFSAAITGSVLKMSPTYSYFTGGDLKDPLLSPGESDAVMAKFPPTLLIAATRDTMMSPTLLMHNQLVRLGVKADLHLWEGLGHAFFFEPDLPQSREVYDVVARFFNENLGGSTLRSR